MPKTQIVSWSEINTLRQCPHKHDLEYVQRWTSPTASEPLRRGSGWHRLLEFHYRTLLDARNDGLVKPDAGAMAAGIERILDECELEDAVLLRWMYEGYVDHFGIDPEWQVVAVEKPFEIWLPTTNGGRSRFKLKGRLDLVVKWKGKLWIVDHKSCKDLPSQQMLELDDQFGLYTWAMQQLGKRIFGSLHSAARTQRNKTKPQELEDRFKRTPMYRTDAELVRIAKDAYLTVARGYGKGEAERHTNSDTCRWRCNFTEACLHGRKTTDEQEISFLTSAGFKQDFTRH